MCKRSGDEGILTREPDRATSLPQAPDRSCDVTLECTHRLAFALALARLTIKIGACLLGVVSLGQSDPV